MVKQPRPFCFNPSKIKAFVLGCDPTAFDKNGNLLEFDYVFDLGKDQRYFSSILKNLNLIGISLKDIYVQNLIADYQKIETAKNKHWEAKAEQYLADRKTEFDQVDPTRKIPVFLTAERLCHFLLNDGEKKRKASEIYTSKTEIPIPPEANKLGLFKPIKKEILKLLKCLIHSQELNIRVLKKEVLNLSWTYF